MHRYFIFIFLFITKLSFCQIEISWEDLEDVEFSDMYIDSINEYILYPHFGLLMLENYMIKKFQLVDMF